jgi:hypothetical protein
MEATDSKVAEGVLVRYVDADEVVLLSDHVGKGRRGTRAVPRAVTPSLHRGNDTVK